jgi:hypothetical protein
MLQRTDIVFQQGEKAPYQGSWEFRKNQAIFLPPPGTLRPRRAAIAAANVDV